MTSHRHRLRAACLAVVAGAAAWLTVAQGARAADAGSDRSAPGDDAVITARAAEPAPPRRPAANCRTRGSVEAGIAVGGGGSARHLGARLDYGEDVPAPAGTPLPPCEQSGIAASLEVGRTMGDLGRSASGDRIDRGDRPPRPRR
jgi:hypothetical protein